MGSREWIGAIELGYVLDERLGVIAKVITVASGAEMGTKSREIAQHFDSQGTPIMVRMQCTCFLAHQSAALRLPSVLCLLALCMMMLPVGSWPLHLLGERAMIAEIMIRFTAAHSHVVHVINACLQIGGGVLAYTLLGISHNERTGECAFLILDPHYTDDEDLFKIQNGQWVAWKSPLGKAAAGGSLFVQNAFYNLLCPQRPNMI